MERPCFAADYATLPAAILNDPPITNVMESLWSDDLRSLLLLCGRKEGGEDASDYERFYALCKVLPLFRGHPYARWIPAFFQNLYGASFPTSEEAIADGWRCAAAQLLRVPQTGLSLLAKKDTPVLAAPALLARVREAGFVPVLDANSLLEDPPATLSEWERRITDCVNALFLAGGKMAVLSPAADFAFAVPHVYHVEKALSAPKKDRAARDLLFAELIRLLSVQLQKQGGTLFLKAAQAGPDVCELLRQTESRVGLPPLFWSSVNLQTREQMLAFCAQPHANSVRWTLCYEDMPSRGELASAIEAAAARYPLGMLSFCTGVDLRLSPFAAEEIEQAWENFLSRT